MPPKTSPESAPKPVRWVASSKEDLSAFPNDVKSRVSGALWDAQIGLKSPAAKPLKGFGDAGVLEVVVDWISSELGSRAPQRTMTHG